MMLTMHYSASIASLPSPDPQFTAFLTLALERFFAPSSGFTLSKGAFSRPPPPHPLNSLRSLKELKLSLSTGFHNSLHVVPGQAGGGSFQKKKPIRNWHVAG